MRFSLLGGSSLLLALALACSDAETGSEGANVTTDPGSDSTTAALSTDTTGDGDGDGDGEGDGDGDGDGEPEPEPLDPNAQYPDGAFEWCSGPADCPVGFKCGEMDTVSDEFGMAIVGSGCVPIEGDVGLGAACELRGYSFADGGYPIDGYHVWWFATDNCARDLQCIFGKYDAVCLPECSDSNGEDACGSDDVCPSGSFSACYPTCDPLELGTCPFGLHCSAWYDFNGVEQFLCGAVDGIEGSTGDVGEACFPFGLGPCQDGLACAPAEQLSGCEGLYCCTEFCDLDDPNACAALGPAFTCVAYFDDPVPAEHANLGHCGG